MKEYAIVFAGGGTKGSYQVGVIKALKELGIKINAVAGSSIGTINGALFASGEDIKLEKLYKNIKMQDILALREKNKIDPNENLFNPKNIFKIIEEVLATKGISNEPLKELLKENLDLDKLYSSKIDFGFITFDVDKKKGVELYKEDIPKDKMIDYILASSCFPIFKPQSINEKKYLDGGIFDNMPISLLVKKGYKNIILIDINGIGRIRRNIYKDVNFKIIKPIDSLGGTFNFNPNKIEDNIKLGYLDTMKAFHKYLGFNYYFTNTEYYKMLNHFTLYEAYALEDVALYYEIDKLKKYNYKTFVKEILIRYEKDLEEYKRIKKDITNIKNIKELIEKKLVFPLMEDLINNYPTLFSSYKGIFKKYINASDSLRILCSENNYKI